ALIGPLDLVYRSCSPWPKTRCTCCVSSRASPGGWARWPTGWCAGGATAASSTATAPSPRSPGPSPPAPARARARSTLAAWTRHLERGLCYAYGCWEVLDARRPRPVDVVLGRSAGLGSTLFAPVSLPGVPVVNQFDYYLHPHAHDLAEEAGPDTAAAYFHW